MRKFFNSAEQNKKRQIRRNRKDKVKRIMARRELERKLRPQIRKISAASKLAESLVAKIS